MHKTSDIPCISIQSYGFSEWSIIKIDELIKHVLNDNISRIEDSISIVFIDFIKRYELVENNELDKLEEYEYNAISLDSLFSNILNPLYSLDFSRFLLNNNIDIKTFFAESKDKDSLVQKLIKVRNVANNSRNYNSNIIILLAYILPELANFYDINFAQCFSSYLYEEDEGATKYNHPGEYIKDIMDEFKVSPKTLATLLKISMNEFFDILYGNRQIDKVIAVSLEKFTGVDEETWLGLQHKYDREMDEIRKKKEFDKQLEDYNIRMADYMRRIQNREDKDLCDDVDSLIEETISKINFLISVLLDEDIYQLEHEAIGWVFVDVIKKNKLTQSEEIVKQVSSYDIDNIFVCSELKIGKIDIIKELLKISLILTEEKEYSSSLVLSTFSILHEICLINNLKLVNCIEIELNKKEE